MSTERRRYRKILTRMHGDEKYRELSAPKPNGQTLWMHLLTGPHTTAVPGLFTVGEAALAETLGWPLAGFRKAWKEIESRGMAEADWRARVVWLPNAVKHNAPESPNVVLSWRGSLDEIPECALKTKAVKQLEAFLKGYMKGCAEALRKALASPSPNQDQEQEQEQEQEEGLPPPPSSKASKSAGVFTGGLPREHLNHAACDPTFSRCVPVAVHSKLAQLLAPKHGGDREKAQAALFEWYPTVWRGLPGDFVMGDAFKFWQAWFDATFASQDASASRPGKPEPKSNVPSADETRRKYLQ